MKILIGLSLAGVIALLFLATITSAENVKGPKITEKVPVSNFLHELHPE